MTGLDTSWLYMEMGSSIWNITMFNGKINYTWPFSIAMLVYQRVPIGFGFHQKMGSYGWIKWWIRGGNIRLQAMCGPPREAIGCQHRQFTGS